MFWLDRIFGQIEEELKEKIASGKTLIIRDEKTASGRVHVGAMRALALHGAIAERLAEAGIPHVFKYEINDMDPMDGLPIYLDKATYEPHMGKPLFMIPSPDGKAKNFAEFYGEEYKQAIIEAGFRPEFYRASELYLSGKMDGVIREALEHAADIRRIYKEVSGGERAENWLPIAVICPTCHKLATTWATDFDGETLAVHCRPGDKDSYAKGCGFEGRVSPFGGNAKLPWKVEWAAKWKVMGVDIEGGGKDHYSKGGARDVARHISVGVFNYPEPFGVPNEFFLIGGQKMSSSKGKGSSAKEIVDLVPSKIFRLALFGKDINQQINFDPEGDTIPVLYDLYDKLALGYKTEKGDDYARLFTYIHTDKSNINENVFLPRFSQIAFIVQMPHLNLAKEVEGMKGSALTEADRKEMDERAQYAKKWLTTCAPEKFVFTLQEDLTDAGKNLSPVQKDALKMLADFIESKEEMPNGADMHAKLHALKEEANISPADLFSAIYSAFLGKGYGPKAGWFLSVLDRGFVLRRLKEASA